ncbi:MAG: hypothetical protein JNM68_05210 [Dinghuibacter sp.]|nr:hypothetical protein [Dinghuibacter sp.]
MGYTQLPEHLFTAYSVSGEIPVNEICQLLEGNRAVVMVKNFLSKEICHSITENYNHHERQREKDSVPGNYIGAYHYNKNMYDYISEVDKAADLLNSLFADTGNPVRDVQHYLGNEFKQRGFQYRNAQYNGHAAGWAVARKWTDNGAYSLKPHDDVAQLTHHDQREFEIQQVKNNTIVGTNFCLSNSHANGGNLVVWNCCTDDEERARLNISETGYPYPLDYLEPFQRLEVEVEPGDLYFLNSKLVHAVTNQQFNERLTVSFFLGKISNNTIIYWT